MSKKVLQISGKGVIICKKRKGYVKVICRHCGVEYPDEANFCPNCATPKEDVPTYKCRKCGKYNFAEAKKCRFCGTNRDRMKPWQIALIVVAIVVWMSVMGFIGSLSSIDEGSSSDVPVSDVSATDDEPNTTTTTKATSVLTTTTKKTTTKKTTTTTHKHTYVDTEYTPNFSQKKATVKRECSSCGETKTAKVDMSTDDISKYLKENCKTYTYEEIARYPDKYKDKLVVFTGEVLQVQEFLGTTTLLVNVTKEGDEYFSYYTDSVYVSYKFTDELKVLEEDIITLYGKMNGEKTYTSVLGALITVPYIEVYYAELNK